MRNASKARLGYHYHKNPLYSICKYGVYFRARSSHVMSIHRNPSAKSHSSIRDHKTKIEAERKHQGKQRAIHNVSPDLELFYVLPTLR